MKRNYLFGMMLSLGLAACGNSNSGNPGISIISLTAQMSSGESGTASITDTGSMTQVDISVSGGMDTGTQTAHIHSGKCGSNGMVAVMLNAVTSGHSTTMIQNRLDSLKGGNFYINVHNSTNPMNINACGNIP